jgi:hypothetical protein
MKTFTRLLLCAALLGAALSARAERIFNQAELDALLAPVALYPDSVLNDILDAASYPGDVREAAAWSRANPQVRGDEAQQLVANLPWQPSVKALVSAPEVLARLDESPQWLADLGEAHRAHGPYLMESVQSLRQRAQANGYPPSHYAPAPSGVVYVRYYDPYVVYGPWFWPAYRPIVWRPFVTRVVVHRPAHVHVHRPVVVRQPVHVQRPVVVRGPTVVPQPIAKAQFRNDPPPRRDNGAPSPARQEQLKAERERERARPPQQGSQHYDRDHDRNRDRDRSPRNEPRGKFAAPDQGGRNDERRSNRGRRD